MNQHAQIQHFEDYQYQAHHHLLHPSALIVACLTAVSNQVVKFHQSLVLDEAFDLERISARKNLSRFVQLFDFVYEFLELRPVLREEREMR
jgi:hypothetical protein